MPSLSQEEENYVRMSLLLSGVCPRAARALFDNEFAPSRLGATIKKEYIKLSELKKKHIINKPQWQLLFPRAPAVPDSITFDIVLVITLIRHLTDLTPPHSGYDQLPHENETTPASDLARIRYYKNYQAHVENGKIDNEFFVSAWDNLSRAITRLGGKLMSQECDQLRTKTLDQSSQEMMLEMKRSNDEIDEIKKSMQSLKTAYEGMTNEFQEFKSTQRNNIPWNVGDRLLHLNRIKSTSEFKMLLLKGTYASYENRVYLAGSVNTGKSTLASVLIGDQVQEDWKSTDGLIIHFGRNGIDIDKRKMIPIKKGSAGHDVFAKLLRGNPEIKCSEEHTDLPSSKSTQGDTEVIYNRNYDDDQTEETKEEGPMRLEVSIREDMLKEILEGNYKMNIAPSDLVDFGGQKSFDMTHQLFIQSKGTFVLMFDGRYGLNDPLEDYKPNDVTTVSILMHWIDSILTYCVDTSVDESKLPKILFAATHGDFYTQDELEMRKAMFIGELTNLFSSNDLHEHIIYQTLFFIDARNKDDPEIHQLTTHLVDIAFEQPSWGQQMPVAWVPLEIQLSEIKTARICKNFVKKSELQGYNLQNDDFVLTDAQFEHFLKMQHSLGKLLYFGEHGIDDFIVIQPSAFVNVLRSFVTDEMFWPKDKEIIDILPNLSKTGVIHRTDLYKLWEQKQFKKLIPTEDLRKYIIEVLIHLDILVEPKHYSGAERSADFFLVPCMIKEKAPRSFLCTEEMDEKAICLSYRLNRSSVPAALFFKLTGSVLNLLPIKETDGRPCLYYKAAVLSVDNDNECRIHMEGSRIVVNLINRASRLQILPDIAASIQECLTLTLTNVLHFYYTCMGKDIKQVDILKLFDTEVGVPCGEGFCFISVNEAMKKKTWTCENEIVHTTDLLRNWMLDKTIAKEECAPDCRGIPTAVLFESPSEKHLLRLASVLDIEMFHEFFLHLGMETKDWHNIQYTYWQPVDAMFMALMTWRDKGSMVTFKKILDAQQKVEDNQHHLCQVLKEQPGLPEIAGFGFEDTPSESFLSRLPNKLGYCVLPLGIELGLSIADIESVFVRHQKQLFSQVYEVLKIWKQKTPENTYSNLMLAIQRVRGKQFLKRNFGCDD